MFSQEALHGVSEVVRERIAAEHEVDLGELSEIASYLSGVTAIDDQKIAAMVWGEHASWDAEETRRLAETLCLDEDLLVALLNPTSAEVLEHVLGLTASGPLLANAGDCPECYELIERVEGISIPEAETMVDVAIACLAHVRVVTEVEEAAPVSEAEFDYDEKLEDSRLDTLLSSYANLPEDDRLRVIAFTLNLAAGAKPAPAPLQHAPADRFSAYERLRHTYMSELARHVFDLLAHSDQGELARSSLASSLGLEDSRALGQLQRSLAGALRSLRSEGLTLAEDPLDVARRGRETFFSLRPEALRAWRAMLQAEAVGSR